MSNIQRVIKYCATAFAILLAIGIISGIASVVLAIVGGITGDTLWVNHSKGKTKNFTESFTDVKSLAIDNSTGELKIKIGETFKVEAENVSEQFNAKVNSSGTLSISDNNSGIHFLWFNFDGFDSPNSKVTVYVPADFIAEEAKLDTGAGNVSVEGLQADYLYISSGAGNISGSDLKAQEVKIDGGVGSVDLSNVNFTDSDFDCGVGNIDVDGILLGKTKIDCGVGEVELEIKGNVDDYGLNVDSGIGTIRLNGDKISDSHKSNIDAENLIKVDGGVGDVRIDIEE
ncbi:MAG: DUF4097 family beta strand repeat-containing protein [Herbinix sp.]|nr:DUF4097 family beta strand repeat-containing protein [Herbinix sp.]